MTEVRHEQPHPGTLKALFRPLRRLYDWVLSWADTPWGPAALFVLAFVESSFFPIPPDPLLIALALGAARKSLAFGALCTVGSVLGGTFGYWIGATAFDAVGLPVLEIYGKVDDFDALAASFRDNGAMAVLIAAITPVPYKLVTIASGAAGVDPWVFVGSSIVGRGFRFFLVAGLIQAFGQPIATFIERWFEVLAIAGAVLLVGGFLAFRYLV